MSTTVERTFCLARHRGRRGGWRLAAQVGPEPAPENEPLRHHPLARRMAMAITCQNLIRDGAAADAASLAGAAGVTRARMTQILNFTCLAPDIQAMLLDLAVDADLRERDLRPVMDPLDWRQQRQIWASLLGR